MAYKIIKGDLLDLFDNGEFDIIIHGCNCFHAMASGIAGQIAKKYPTAVWTDKQTVKGNVNKLSSYTYCLPYADKGSNRGIINLYTQYHPGKDLNLPALDLGFYKLSKGLGKNLKIGIPKIGAGVAGGDWDIIESIIKGHMKDHNVALVEYKPKKIK